MFLETDTKEIKKLQTEREVSLGRHRAQCSICRHPQRDEIEEAWLDWTGLATMECKYKVSRDSIYRHSRAFGLDTKRRRNLIPAYEHIVERGDVVGYNGSNVISALRELAKLISAQEAAEAAQSADPKPAAQGTTGKERDNGALAGSLTALLDETPGLEPGQGQNEQEEPQGPEPPTVQTASQATQSADPKPRVQETIAKESGISGVAALIDKALNEKPGVDPGQGQNEPQGPEPPTVQ
jgi:hypothetical protein